MGLEAATYIEDLVDTNPTGADDKNQGDNHLRLIKEVLQNQFPNLGAAAMTATSAELTGFVPTGCVIMWTGTSGNIPTGWTICDGTSGTPNLTSQFVLAGTSSGTTGGSNDTVSRASEFLALSVANMPAHNHHSGANSLLIGGASGSGVPTGTAGGNTVGTEATVGSGSPFQMTMPAVTGANTPAYYTLVYIMKTQEY